MAEDDEELGHVDIDDTVQLFLKYDEEVQDRSKHHSRSIYMVPSVYRDLSPRSFTPWVLSIGPLHHHDEHLKGFEVQKATCMHNLLSPLDSTPEQILKECVMKATRGHGLFLGCLLRSRSKLSHVSLRSLVTCVGLHFLSLGDARSFAAPRSSRSHGHSLSVFLSHSSCYFLPFQKSSCYLSATFFWSPSVIKKLLLAFIFLVC
nr:putative UPF0481 protein At3g02645 [Tanacetum cinerariifolium]